MLAGALGVLMAVGVARADDAPASWQAYQRNYHFQQLDDRDGLTQNSVSLIFQDQAGFMWFATQAGLFRYDGYKLTRYTHDPNRADSLPEDYRVTSLADAGNGRLWVGSTSGGLILFDPGADLTIPLPAAVQRRQTSVTSLLSLPGGDVLVGSTLGVDRLTGGADKPRVHTVWAEAGRAQASVQSMTRCSDGTIYASAGNKIVVLDMVKSTGRVLTDTGSAINALFCDRQGRLLLGNGDGLANVNRGTGTLTSLWPSAVGTGTGVVSMVADETGRLWLGLTDHTLVRVGSDGSVVKVTPAPLGITGGLPDSPIKTMFVDRTGLLWVGTLTSGVVWTRTDNSPISSVLNLTGDPRTKTFVSALKATADGQFWVAMSGPGLVRYDPVTREVTSYKRALLAAIEGSRPVPAATPAVRWDIRIYNILVEADGNLLLPSNYGLLRLDPKAGTAAYAHLDGEPVIAPVRTIFRASNGDMWLAPYDAGLAHYHDGRMVQHFDATQGLGSNNVVTIVQDRSGKLWTGTTNGVSMIDPATGKVRTFREIPGDSHSLAGSAVPSLLVDKQDRIWVGSLSGISRLEHVDAAGAKFQRYGLDGGLPDDAINCMLEDADGQIWFSTNLGLGRLNTKTGSIRSFGIADGTQGNEYTSGACSRSPGGLLLFGGHGFDIVQPKHHHSGPLAPVTFTAFYAGEKRVNLPQLDSQTLTLGTGDRSVSATFSTLDYAAPAHNRFRIRLLGSRHPGWSAPTLDHTVAYSDLEPGDYRLEVQAVLRDGTPGRTASLPFYIPVVWWWSLPMRLVYAAAIALLILIAVLGWRSHHLEQVRHRRQLRLRESRLRQALWGSGDEFWDWNLEQGTILRLGPEGTPGGHHEQSVPADEWRRTMVHPEDLANLDLALAEHLAGRTEHFEVEHRVRGRDEEWTWVLSRGKIIERDAEGKPLRVCGTERDISAIRAADRERRIASEVIRNMSEAVTVTDLDFRFMSVNTAFTRMTGYAEHEVLGRDASMLNGSRHAPDSYTQLRQTLAETGHWRGELWQRRKDGEEFLCWVELNEVCDASGQRTHMIGVLTDITDRKRAEQELRYLANYDALTGLPNRTLLTERIGHAIIRARRGNRKVAVLFLDLDRFKHVNDSMGHAAGDRMLKAAGSRLRHVVREGDSVARLGGDEFTVVLENIGSSAEAERVAEKIISAFEEPLELDNGQEVVISPSIGIAMHPDHGQVPSDLLKFADTAMYQAKDHGRKTWMVYTEAMDAAARLRATTVAALRKALERNELSLVYQPKLSLLDNRITGVEALLRWRSGDLGNVSPGVFIPIAEETGMIVEIGDWVVAQACAQLARWRNDGIHGITMSINVSVAQLL
ncbi:MAG TPA: diguanylate cyclase, partial [Rhodanobacteraceae bacterium]|nr:diguanylate cyclase [Rhodanobacteraceae bacterium]